MIHDTTEFRFLGDKRRGLGRVGSAGRGFMRTSRSRSYRSPAPRTQAARLRRASRNREPSLHVRAATPATLPLPSPPTAIRARPSCQGVCKHRGSGARFSRLRIEKNASRTISLDTFLDARRTRVTRPPSGDHEARRSKLVACEREDDPRRRSGSRMTFDASSCAFVALGGSCEAENPRGMPETCSRSTLSRTRLSSRVCPAFGLSNAKPPPSS